MIRLIQQWWNFSQCWGGVGAPLFWWTTLAGLLFIVSAVSFLRRHPSGHALIRARRAFLFCMVAAIVIHFFILLLTWSQVWGTLYITSYHWKPGEREENAFIMWQAAFSLAVLSSCLLTGSAIMMKPEGAANQAPEGTARKLAAPQR